MSPDLGLTAACVGRLNGFPAHAGAGLYGSPSVCSNSPSGDQRVIVWVPSSAPQTSPSGPIQIPCDRSVKLPWPQLPCHVPSAAKTITGCSMLRVKT